MSTRWQRATLAEAEFWKKQSRAIRDPAYRKEIAVRAHRVEKWLGRFLRISPETDILEIGGGGTQLIDFFACGERHAVDPLACLYQEQFGGVLNSEVKWTQGKAEALPYPDESFDIIISRNTLDHVELPDKALAEIQRVLRPGAILYLGLNTLSGVLFLIRTVKKSAEHPSVFSPSGIARRLRGAGFAMLDSEEDAPENMVAFVEGPGDNGYRSSLHRLFLRLGCYHFSEFILKKPPVQK